MLAITLEAKIINNLIIHRVNDTSGVNYDILQPQL